ncbi:MAG: Gfo/Idh/MocA family oxidoreductase [Fibrobacterota bacterium]
MADIRFGLVGCGRISKNHIEAIAETEGAVLVAVCDSIKERAEEAGKLAKAGVYTDYAKMLECKDIDAVSICTPSGLHPRHGILAARAGKHVVCEKPMGITLKDVDEFIDVCDASDVRLFVVKQNRLNATLQLVKKAVDKGRFGRLYMAHANVLWTRPQEYYDSAKWRGTWEFDGGAFMNQASHYVDALQWLMGPVDSVMAMTATMARKIETEDTGSVVMKFRNGAIGSMNVTMLVYPSNMEGSITLIGEKGTVKVGGVAVNRLEYWKFADYDDDDGYVKQCNYTPPNVYGFGHKAYYKNVVDVLQQRCEPDTDGRSGRKSLELILGIYKSAKEGRRVSLPLDV